MNTLATWIYEVSTALLTPVIATLLLVLGLTLVSLGAFLREALDRRRTTPASERFRRRLEQSGDDASATAATFFDATRRDSWSGLLRRFAAAGDSFRFSSIHLEPLAADCEILASRRVARLNLLARSGPILGMMGTLIPMGPALFALSNGDLHSLAASLVVAFTTTVVGLLIGLIAIAMSTVRRHWYAHDVATIDHVIGCLRPNDRSGS